jgi:putative radical SAM enzyme (TIGR03279 family)
LAVTITAVLEGSACSAEGIRPGDRLVSINGYEISDELDLRFRAAEGKLKLLLHRPGEGLSHKIIDLEENDPIGLELEDFRAKACNNKCVFCFVDQLPRGVRRTLKFKDDDFRLSFLHGNYLTLTNLLDKEIDRIIEQRLSPLYVSVHSTDPEIRAIMLGKSIEHCRLEPMRRLIRGGITIHAQVVLCPGINDGRYLERTIRELAQLFPGLASVAIVPLGTSRFRGNLPDLVEVVPSYCEQIIRQVSKIQEQLRKQLGVTFAYLADEFYLQAGFPLPAPAEYDGFALLEDGIGMLRHFDENFRRCIRRKWDMSSGGPDGTLVTGELFYPFLVRYAQRIVRRFGGRLRVVRVENQFMGNKITVAGLLAGQDVAAALKDRDLGCFVVIPGECLARDAQLFLDNMSKEQLADSIKTDVRDTSRCVEGFFAALCGDSVRKRISPPAGKQYPRKSM